MIIGIKKEESTDTAKCDKKESVDLPSMPPLEGKGIKIYTPN